MTTPRKIIWIDDNPNRKSTAADLGARFLDVRGQDLGPLLKAMLDGPPPRLVIVDHVLDKSADTHPLFSRGSTIAEAIKERWPSCPVIGVTNADKRKRIDRRTQGAYDALFPFHNFGEYFDRMRGVANGFALIARTDGEVGKLIGLLKPPHDERARLRDALSDDLKVSPQDRSVASRMFRWVEHLFDRPGFLLDKPWSATFLGLNDVGFDRALRHFDRARYNGVFARPGDHRWWSGRLSAELFKVCEPELGELSWHVGRRLPGLGKEHFSTCYYCRGDFPEIVAFLDEEGKERRAMHLKCTVLHPCYKRELYFEDMRMMRGD